MVKKILPIILLASILILYVCTEFPDKFLSTSSANYQIIFDPNADTVSGEMSAIDNSDDDIVKLPKNAYVREGYNFNNWNTKPDGSGSMYTDKEIFQSDDRKLTLFAQWSKVIIIDASAVVSCINVLDHGNYNIIITGNMSTNIIMNIADALHKTDAKVSLDLSKCKNMNNIPVRAFKNRENLISIIIPKGVVFIEENAFEGCTNLINITLPTTLEIINNNAFNSCESLRSCNIPDDVKFIGDSAFAKCSNLITFNLPIKVTEIQNGTFAYCEKLKTIMIHNKLVSIGRNAFYSCESLETIVIPSSVKNIGSSAFSRCTNITFAIDPKNKNFIEQNRMLFDIKNGNKKLIAAINPAGDVTIPGDIETIAEWAFSECNNMDSITIPSNVTTIEYAAFYCCQNLSTIIFSEGLKQIGNLAFYHCDNLTTITLPNSLDDIGYYAFYHCNSLSSVILPSARPPNIHKGVFQNNSIFRKIYVPTKYVSEYQQATNWSLYATDIKDIADYK